MDNQNNEYSCNYYSKGKCRSCPALGSDILTAKQLKVQKAIKSLESFINSNTKIEKLTSLENPFNSRAKARLTVSGSTEEPTIGLIDREFNGIELESCPLHLKIINEILRYLPDIISKYKLTPYNIKERTGELKSIIVHSNTAEDQVILRFVVRSNECIPRLKKAVPLLCKEFPQLRVISANIQEVPHQIPEGPEEIILTEHKTIKDTFSEIDLFYAPQCFSQVTPKIAEALYSYVQKIVSEKMPNEVIDLFCGVGGFSLFSSQFSKKISGIEISDPAIKCAKLAAEENNMSNLSFYNSDVSEILSTLGNPCLLICNPPRRGLKKDIDKIIKLGAKTIVYSSCNPETLSFDLASLSKKYTLQSIAPFDMFPLTEHLEIVAVLESSS